MSDATERPLTQAEMLQKSNKETTADWPIDVNQDPYSIALEEFNPAHPLLFEANTMMPYFARRVAGTLLYRQPVRPLLVGD